MTIRVPMLVAACVVAAACDTARTEARKTDSTTAAVAAPNVVVVKTRDYAFDAPDTVRAGVTTIHLQTNPGQELHQVGLIRLDSGKTGQDFAEAMKAPGPFPKWATEIAGVNPPAPGQAADVTFDLAAGNYLLVCFVPSADHVPHIAKGMSRPMVVTGGTVAAAALPAADIEMKLTDYAFVVSAPLTTGKHVIRVVNDAQQTHEVQVVRLAPGKTGADVAAWIDSMKGPPPGEPLSGVSGLGVGQAATFPLTLAPGDYALLCFIPDAKDGKPHSVHGMIHNFKVS